MTDKTKSAAPECGADMIVRNLVAHGTTHVFGIPGAKVDRLFDALVDSPIETVVTRHEQNAAFIAGGIGRLTGKAGVAIATSGPGASNFVTGLATANSEGDPVLAIGGAVKLADRLKLTHQSMDTVALFQPITKYSAEITSPPPYPKRLPTPCALPKAAAPVPPLSARPWISCPCRRKARCWRAAPSPDRVPPRPRP
ncbi:thiamine pyrophosphate-binding protein [Komagataeibacter rhaeticus]|nr:thiamine pyrophosphate-binding protein [Komagataeibacter rhaeticus]